MYKPSQPLQVSPSSLGKYFFLNCERMLRYTATPERLKEQEGIPVIDTKENSVAEAIIDSGRKWEEKVVRNKLANCVILGPEKEHLHEQVLPYQQVLSALKNAPTGKFLYQSFLNPPDSFYRRYHLDQKSIHFSPCRPDLIHLNGDKKNQVQLEVIDIKASDTLQFSHCAQAVLYAIILQDIVATKQIKRCLPNIDSCKIWLFEQDHPKKFEIAKVIDPLETFLCEKLSSILLQPAQDAQWSLSQRCEWCDYLGHCRKEAEKKKDISLLPYLSPEAKHFLVALDPPCKTLEDFQTLLTNENCASTLSCCGTLRGAEDRLKMEIEALLSRSKNRKSE